MLSDINVSSALPGVDHHRREAQRSQSGIQKCTSPWMKSMMSVNVKLHQNISRQVLVYLSKTFKRVTSELKKKNNAVLPSSGDSVHSLTMYVVFL